MPAQPDSWAEKPHPSNDQYSYCVGPLPSLILFGMLFLYSSNRLRVTEVWFDLISLSTYCVPGIWTGTDFLATHSQPHPLRKDFTDPILTTAL